MYYLKIVGWLVFIIGFSLIIWALCWSYNVYTAKSAVSEFFKVPVEKTSTPTGETQDIQAQLQTMIGEQLKGFLPANSITQILNLAVFSLLIFILIFGGMQIATLGIKLIK